MTYIAFLRAINVGGRATVKMDDVRAAFLRAGCKNVRSVIQSGNVIFDAPASGRAALATRICQRLEALIGKDPGVCMRTARELETLAEAVAFRKSSGEPDVKLYVAFVGGKPKRSPRLPLRDEKEALEVFATSGPDVIIISRREKNGLYGSPYRVVEKAFGVPATIRNVNTVSRIAQLIASE
jgi:uncharacterized protein (DUF1697 family)